jgi:Spy/CpxP family protein refolding chaperone
MKTNSLLAITLLASVAAFGQTAPKPPMPPEAGLRVGPGNVGFHREMGKWWQNSDTAKKLNLTDAQIQRLDQTFYDHRVKLIDLRADMEKQDLKLQSLLDDDQPNESMINSQVDEVLSARGKLEREYTMMNLDLRLVLSLDQWKQLKSIRGEHHGDRIFFHRFNAPGVPPLPETAPVPGPPPGAMIFNLPVPPPDDAEMF